ncbi:MAG: hypothetical protein L3K11_06285 [Thermoplasmata archaeon]|nr:hypothetical protein [Thermoplasmata archaeon]
MKTASPKLVVLLGAGASAGSRGLPHGVDSPEDPESGIPWYASIQDRPPERPTSDGPTSRLGKFVFASVFLAGVVVLAILWAMAVLPLFQGPAHATSICFGRLHACWMISASDEWYTELLGTAIHWAFAGLFAYGAVRTLTSRPPPTASDGRPTDF